MAKLPENTVQEVIVAQTNDPLKSKGKSKSNNFFWESYNRNGIGKKSTMAKWAQEINRSMNKIVNFDKNGNIESYSHVQRVKEVKVDKRTSKKGK